VSQSSPFDVIVGRSVSADFVCGIVGRPHHQHGARLGNVEIRHRPSAGVSSSALSDRRSHTMHWLLPALVVSASVSSPSINAKSYRVAALLTAVSASGEQRFRLLQVLPKPLHGILSKLGAGTDPTADGEAQQLPDAAYAFVGNWKLVEEQNYAAFLEEAQGLPWMKRKLAEHIHPTPNFYIEEGTLHCKTICVGAKPVHEILKTGPTTFHEPSTRQKVHAFLCAPCHCTSLLALTHACATLCHLCHSRAAYALPPISVRHRPRRALRGHRTVGR
jgi:hypothetical protein